jgi:hypothetical protein
MAYETHIPDPAALPVPADEIARRIEKWGQTRPPVLKQIESFIVRRDGKVGDVGIQISRYCEPFIDPGRWMYLYELHAGECAWEIRQNFFDLAECRQAARRRAESIDTQFLYKAVYERKKREEKNAAWDSARLRSNIAAPRDRKGNIRR